MGEDIAIPAADLDGVHDHRIGGVGEGGTEAHRQERAGPVVRRRRDGGNIDAAHRPGTRPCINCAFVGDVGRERIGDGDVRVVRDKAGIGVERTVVKIIARRDTARRGLGDAQRAAAQRGVLVVAVVVRVVIRLRAPPANVVDQVVDAVGDDVIHAHDKVVDAAAIRRERPQRHGVSPPAGKRPTVADVSRVERQQLGKDDVRGGVRPDVVDGDGVRDQIALVDELAVLGDAHCGHFALQQAFDRRFFRQREGRRRPHVVVLDDHQIRRALDAEGRRVLIGEVWLAGIENRQRDGVGQRDAAGFHRRVVDHVEDEAARFTRAQRRRVPDDFGRCRQALPSGIDGGVAVPGRIRRQRVGDPYPAQRHGIGIRIGDGEREHLPRHAHRRVERLLDLRAAQDGGILAVAVVVGRCIRHVAHAAHQVIQVDHALRQRLVHADDEVTHQTYPRFERSQRHRIRPPAGKRPAIADVAGVQRQRLGQHHVGGGDRPNVDHGNRVRDQVTLEDVLAVLRGRQNGSRLPQMVESRLLLGGHQRIGDRPDAVVLDDDDIDRAGDGDDVLVRVRDWVGESERMVQHAHRVRQCAVRRRRRNHIRRCERASRAGSQRRAAIGRSQRRQIAQSHPADAGVGHGIQNQRRAVRRTGVGDAEGIADRVAGMRLGRAALIDLDGRLEQIDAVCRRRREDIGETGGRAGDVRRVHQRVRRTGRHCELACHDEGRSARSQCYGLVEAQQSVGDATHQIRRIAGTGVGERQRVRGRIADLAQRIARLAERDGRLE